MRFAFLGWTGIWLFLMDGAFRSGLRWTVGCLLQRRQRETKCAEQQPANNASNQNEEKSAFIAVFMSKRSHVNLLTTVENAVFHTKLMRGLQSALLRLTWQVDHTL